MPAARIKPQLLTDSSEKEGHRWLWEESKLFKASQVVNLQYGDYSLDCFLGQSWLYLERKGSAGELYGNLFTKDSRRFYERLEEIRSFRFKYIIVECSVSDIYYFKVPRSRHNPYPKFKPNPDACLKKLVDISMDYGVNIIFAGARSKNYALSIIKRAYERWLKLSNDQRNVSRLA